MPERKNITKVTAMIILSGLVVSIFLSAFLIERNFLLLIVNKRMDAWHQFKRDFNKTYNSTELDLQKMKTFFKNLDDVHQHNSDIGNTFIFGINHMSDLSYEEIYELNKLDEEPMDYSKIVEFEDFRLEVSDSVEVPDSFDWRDRNAVSRVRDQKLCGSCYAFATLHAIESQLLIHRNKSLELSTQEIVDCGRGHAIDECKGGAGEGVLSYINANNGISLEKDYPYTSEFGNCKKNLTQQNISIEKVGYAGTDEEEIKKALYIHGPLVVALDILHNSFFRYQSGVYFESECDPKNEFSHAALLVGYGRDENGIDFWTVKNSWSTAWGEEGYIRMARNKNNHCRVGDSAFVPILKL